MGQDLSDRKSRCKGCGDWFPSHPRLGKRQRTCGKEACRKRYRARYRRRYRRVNRKEELGYQSKRKANRPLDYWKNYRASHPAYVLRNQAASRLRKQLGRQGLQRQLDIVQLVVFPKKIDAFRQFATSHRSLLRQCLVRQTPERRVPP